jgi:hypothetical protein
LIIVSYEYIAKKQDSKTYQDNNKSVIVDVIHHFNLFGFIKNITSEANTTKRTISSNPLILY